jgi:hypothetical protein
MTAGGVREAAPAKPNAPILENHLASTLRWHFHPVTGSPFWLSRAPELGFDPLRDIRTLSDLRKFPDVSGLLRTVPVNELIPRGNLGMPFQVYESGGTLGAPKRIIELGARAEGVDWVDRMLDRHGFPREVHWLHVGPTGPHIVGRSMRRLAENRGGACFTIDFDPRWVKRQIAAQRQEVADDYIEHVLDQVEAVVANQDIRVLFITPAVLEALCAREGLRRLLAERLRGLIWSGTSIGDATLRMVRERYFPHCIVLGIYGNSLMGIAPQRPALPDEPYPCVFQPYWPRATVEVVDPETGAPVAYGQRGRVLVHLLTRDMFLPNVLERDTAIRVAPETPGEVDGLAGIAPFRSGEAQIIEGVY